MQGETLPQGSLGRLTLCPESSVQRSNRARVLLASTFQLISGFGLDEKEVLYLTANAADFGNLSFSALPTQLAATFTPNQALFGQFLRLASYATLRKGPGGNSDGLIGLFQDARQTFPATASQPGTQALANLCQAGDALTKRAAGTVQATVAQLWGAARSRAWPLGQARRRRCKSR